MKNHFFSSHSVDTQKQNRIEQLINDLNKYKKIEKDLQSLQSKHQELETNFNSKLTNLTEQRDQLRQTCDELTNQIPTDPNPELTDLKTKNDLLKQRNGKIMDQLNKLSPNLALEENQSIE